METLLKKSINNTLYNPLKMIKKKFHRYYMQLYRDYLAENVELPELVTIISKVLQVLHILLLLFKLTYFIRWD